MAVVMRSSPVVEGMVLIVVGRAVVIVLHCRPSPERCDDVESLGAAYARDRSTLCPQSLPLIPVGCLGIFEDVDEVLALWRRSVSRQDLVKNDAGRCEPTVLIILPELFMMVIVSCMGIFAADRGSSDFSQA
jgi:hypothetical protein